MRQPLLFKQLRMKMSVGYDVIFYNMGLHKVKSHRIFAYAIKSN